MANVIVERRPRSRGVTQLMYVGDDDAVENAVGTSPAAFKAAGVALLTYAVVSKASKNARLCMGALGAFVYAIGSGRFSV